MRDLPQIIDYDKEQLAYALANAIKERDEARNKMADALQEVDLRTLDFERMKQERDGLLLELEEYRSISENIGAVKAVSEKEKATRERDEAIADRDIARLSALDSDRAHDRMVGELEKVYKERDDALSQIVQAECRAERFCQERDEAREAFIEARKHREQLNSLLQSYEACWDEIKTTLGEPEEGDQTCDLDRVLKAIRKRNEAREALGYIAHAGLSARHIEDYAKEFLRREEDAK